MPNYKKIMVESGIILIKYWLEVSAEEQTRRLESRIDDGRKTWKLSPMDVLSYERWDDYTRARDEMFKATDTPWAPWFVARSEDTKRVRLNVIRRAGRRRWPPPTNSLRRSDFSALSDQSLSSNVVLPLGAPFGHVLTLTSPAEVSSRTAMLAALTFPRGEDPAGIHLQARAVHAPAVVCAASLILGSRDPGRSRRIRDDVVTTSAPECARATPRSGIALARRASPGREWLLTTRTKRKAVNR